MATSAPPDLAGHARAARARAAAYAWLAASLRDPDDGTAAAMAGADARADLFEAARVLDPDGSGGLRAAAARLARAARRTRPSARREEEARVFGHVVRGPVPAYEIEYGTEHFLGQARRLSDLGAFYLAFGVRPRASAHERADHAAVEAEFLSFLAAKEAVAAGAGDGPGTGICRDAARRFLEEHFGRFLPALARRVAEREPGGFLAASLAFGGALVEAHGREVGVRPGRADLALRPLGPADLDTRVTCSAGDPLAAARPAAAGGDEA